MILYLLRHGKTDWDTSNRIQGWRDIPLSPSGITQAHLAAENLKSHFIETIYASDLKRAKKTADIISASFDVPVHYTKRLREMNFGKAEGVKFTDLEAKFSYIYHAFNDVKNPERYAISYPEGETIGEVQQRFVKFIHRLSEDGRENVLLVTHEMLLRIFIETCLKKNISLKAGSVMRVVYDVQSKKFRQPKILF
ncbi:MAG: histidine phosphatase family protein [Alphaproteobacteria bacterium]|nr:histidine phosphatase family protein [Alphaproteobacteria bacterium]